MSITNFITAWFIASGFFGLGYVAGALMTRRKIEDEQAQAVAALQRLHARAAEEQEYEAHMQFRAEAKASRDTQH